MKKRICINQRKNLCLRLSAFSLMELLIVIAMIVLVALVAILLLNPKKQIDKAQANRRKKDLSTLKNILEDWYNDKQCYPKPNEICYNSAVLLSDGTYTCNICGREDGSPNFTPYLSSLPCDPQHPSKKYLYQVNSLDCPTWYRVYTKLIDTYVYEELDQATIEVGCQFSGCGPSPDYGYSYGISSPNIDLERPTDYLYCNNPNGCNTCLSGNPPDPLGCLNYDISQFCDGKKTLYPTVDLCLAECNCSKK